MPSQRRCGASHDLFSASVTAKQSLKGSQGSQRYIRSDYSHLNHRISSRLCCKTEQVGVASLTEEYTSSCKRHIGDNSAGNRSQHLTTLAYTCPIHSSNHKKQRTASHGVCSLATSLPPRRSHQEAPMETTNVKALAHHGDWIGFRFQSTTFQKDPPSRIWLSEPAWNIDCQPLLSCFL